MKELCGIKMYSPLELKQITGFGKNKIYELINSGALEYVNFNGKKMVTEQQIKSAIESLTVKKKSPKLYPR